MNYSKQGNTQLTYGNLEWEERRKRLRVGSIKETLISSPQRFSSLKSEPIFMNCVIN